MPGQRWLPMGGLENLEELWHRFPQPSRREVIKQYARLMVRAAALTSAQLPTKEVLDDSDADPRMQQDPPRAS